jgi:two-component system sensor histidine kinase RegB
MEPFQDTQASPDRSLTVPAKNLSLLAVLRCIVVLCQVFTVIWASGRLASPLPMLPLSIAIAAQAIAACVAWWHGSRGGPVPHRTLFGHLAFDVLAISTVLYFAGGSTNPFMSLLLIPLVIVAATLPARFTWMMAALATASYTFLMFYYVPLPMGHANAENGFHLHVMGMWGGFLVAAASVAFFAVRMGEVRRQRDSDVARIREQALTDRYVVRLGALAAGAAHELGTPLSIIAVLSKEMANDCQGDPTQMERLTILREQVERCKTTLSAIAAESGSPRAEGGRPMPVDHYLDELLEQWHATRPKVLLSHNWNGPDPAPVVNPEPGLGQVLISLLNNAADATAKGDDKRVEVDVVWTRSQLTVTVRDHGPGFAGDLIRQAVEPFVTTKTEGMGLGLFLTKAIIDQLGGELALSNRPDGGAEVRIGLPLKPLEPTS